MTELSLTLTELGAVIFGSVVLAVTDGAALSRMAISALGKRLGVSPREIRAYDKASDGEETDEKDE